MNKVVAVLGVIVLLTLAMLFFCIGFFTGSTVTPGSISGAISEEIKKATGESGGSDSEKISKEAIEQKLGGIGDIKSVKLSDKIMGILADAGYRVENFSEMIKAKAQSFSKSSSRKKNEGNQITVDSLLREMAISHDPQDDCSTKKTTAEINRQKMKPVTDQELYGKKVVFIGYFKNKIALQIQKLLATKGYKTHVEMSKDGHDSFVFCGPFKKDETAAALLKWLKFHDFSEARMINITKEAVEETLYDAMNDGADELPKNSEPLPPEKPAVPTVKPVNTLATSANVSGRIGGTTVAPTRPVGAIMGTRPGVGTAGVTGVPIINPALNPAINRVGAFNPVVNQRITRQNNAAVPQPAATVFTPQNGPMIAPQQNTVVNTTAAATPQNAQITLPRM